MAGEGTRTPGDRLGTSHLINTNHQQYGIKRGTTPDPGEPGTWTPSRADRSAAGSRIEHWLEWKQKCAHGLCSGDARRALKVFAAARFDQFARTYAYKTNVSVESVCATGKDSWHLFETHLMTRNNKQGKRYKDWLFSRTADGKETLDAVAGGATLLMRDVVRDFLCHEYESGKVLSLSTVVEREGEAVITIEDLLPGTINPADEVATREFERLAREHAARFFENLSQRERVAVLARELGISLAHPTVVRIAGCSKSVLVEALAGAVERTASSLSKEYSADDPESVRILTAMTIRELSQRVRGWGTTSSACSSLISAAEAE